MAVQRFTIQTSDEALADLNDRLKHTRFPKQSTLNGWERGTDTEYLLSFLCYWRDKYNWREQEKKLNSLNHFICNIDEIDVHFIHERGRGPNPIPVILTHGWPDSFLRYEKIIPLLTDPARYGGDPADSFDVIIPSIPGFGFSSQSSTKGMNNDSISELWVKLMTEELGYYKFAAGGGDMGSGITRYMAYHHPDQLIGIHLTDVGIIRSLMTSNTPSLLTDEELQYQKNALDWIAKEGGYMSIQSTKPQTLSYGISDSPIGLASWILDKFHAWSDCQDDLSNRFTMDELLNNIMLYWITNSFATSANRYYDNSSLPPIGKIDVPTGIALFSGDVLPPPKEWVKRNFNLTQWSTITSGGHFTAMEEPEQFAEDIRAFYRPLRNK